MGRTNKSQSWIVAVKCKILDCLFLSFYNAILNDNENLKKEEKKVIVAWLVNVHALYSANVRLNPCEQYETVLRQSDGISAFIRFIYREITFCLIRLMKTVSKCIMHLK